MLSKLFYKYNIHVHVHVCENSTIYKLASNNYIVYTGTLTFDEVNIKIDHLKKQYSPRP